MMGWSIGYDTNWHRDIGYGVPAVCDHPHCDAQIDRGLGHVCGSDPYGGDYGCGLFFCWGHLSYRSPRGADRSVANCVRCLNYKSSFKPKPDTAEWLNWKLTHESWEAWRQEHPAAVERIKAQLAEPVGR